MKLKKPSFKFTLISGVILILLVNALALASVAYNRSAKDSELILTERELAKTYMGNANESSGMELNLNWRVPQSDETEMGYGMSIYGRGVSASWLNKTKLAELGFDVSMPETSAGADRYYEKTHTKYLFIVLELDGPARMAVLEQVKNAPVPFCGPQRVKVRCKQSMDLHNSRVLQEENVLSRLFAVDAGPDDAALRARYPDKSKYAIVRGQMRLVLSRTKGEPSLAGYIVGLNIKNINVPKEFIDELKEIGPMNYSLKRSQHTAHYEVTLAFGNNHEPWIVSAKRVEK